MGYATVMFPIEGRASLGIHWLYAGSGSVAERNSDGVTTGGQLSMNGHAFSAVFAKRFSNLVGFGTKISGGVELVTGVVKAVEDSCYRDDTLVLVTWDEGGGFFDHVAPPQVDAYGMSVRVPLWVVSPYAKKGPVRSRLAAEHTSTLKLIESLHGLPTLTSRNHLFDTSTPTGGNYEAGGAPAPPRDGRRDISDLLDLFQF